MTTTTLTAILAQMRTVIVALTPAKLSDRGFAQVPDGAGLREWSPGAGEVALRHFEILRSSPVQDPPLMDPAARRVLRDVTLEVAYPVTPAGYGDGYLIDLEDLADDDAAQLRDALYSPGNLVAGQLATFVTTNQLDRGDPAVRYLSLVCRVEFWQSMTLT